MTESITNHPIVQICKEAYHKVEDKAQQVGRRISNFADDHAKKINFVKKVAILALGILSVAADPVLTVIGFTAGLFFSKHVQSGVDKTTRLFKRQNGLVKGAMIVGAVATPFVPVVGPLILGALAGSEIRKMMK